MANFIVEFPLKTQKFQEDILLKRLSVAQKIYNALVTVTLKKYKEMIKTRRYKDALETKDNKTLTSLRKEFGINEYAFHRDVKHMQQTFKKSIDSNTSQKLATNLWKAYDKLIFGKGKKIHYKKFDALNSVEGKSNNAGIRVKDKNLLWIGLKIPIVIDEKNAYEVEAFENKICYSRIVRKFVRSKVKFYIQIIFEGKTPAKRWPDTGYFKKRIGSGRVGLDIGTQTLAVSSDTSVRMIVLADKVKFLEAEKRRLLRKMDRSKRAMNPLNFNSNGTVKSGRRKWVFSNRYLILRLKLKEIYRKQTAVRKYQHECLANELLILGNKIYVEKMNYSGLQKRAKKDSDNPTKRKKRFGESLGNRAPAMFLTILDRKLNYFDEQLIKINTQKARASQFNHIEETYTKKKLSQRWNNFNGFKIQRDLYSAYLIQHTNDDLETFNVAELTTNFNKFKNLHDQEIDRLSKTKNLSSIAI